MAQGMTMSEALTMNPALREPERPDVVGQPMEQMSVGEPAETAEDESHYPTGTRFKLILFSIGLVLTMASLDSSIIAVAVPSLTAHWHSIRDVGWYSTAYRLSQCSFQFMFGRLYKMFSVKAIYLVSIMIFITGSLVCATAPSSTAFIVGRAICGLSCGGIVAGCFTLFRQALPLRKRAMYASIFSAVEGISDITGPMLGGVLVEKLSWRWCFWINVPVGVVTLAVTAFCLKDTRHPSDIRQLTLKQKLSELDLPGTLLFFPAILCLFIALTWAGTRLPWSSPTVIALFCVFGILLAVFAVEQWLRGDAATLPPRILKNRNVLAGAVFSLACNGGTKVIEYYLPTYLQAVKGYSPARSAVLLLPLILCFCLAMLVQGTCVNAVGYYVPFMLAGAALMPIAGGLMTTLSVGSGLIQILGYSAFLGFAGGIGFQAPQVAVQNTLPEQDSHMGLAVILFAQNFGPAIFIAAAQTVLTNRLSENLGKVLPSMDPAKIENMGLGDLKGQIGASKLRDVLKGLDKSLTETWYLGVAVTCITIVGSGSMKWTKIKQRRE
ncbi:uncharacterized protein LTR77_010949 [Saxophila tyrrhenica]|uniref:Major facilitator superfamily (MFS) profile domain-containing protein n=1 Tax=Saxophila tyrrhenica TaxID=1690608 RepID=A0AAV9NUQ2_9PEZI|nr:hypothetical protein LTR77_010949 [Saxophila tyrrhenica]